MHQWPPLSATGGGGGCMSSGVCRWWSWCPLFPSHGLGVVFVIPFSLIGIPLNRPEHPPAGLGIPRSFDTLLTTSHPVDSGGDRE
ncbi:hypothetical protein L208DRAFT_1397885 [Tricholoma matsutake]|nr:hypothetical protein L208DRAFT_1397885 [Tricholoma matsutake 945]